MGVPPMPATARLTPKLGRFRTHPEWGSQSLVGRLRIHSCPADTNGEKRLYFWRNQYARRDSNPQPSVPKTDALSN